MDKHHPKTHKKTNLIYRIKQAKTLPPQDIIFDLTDSSFTLLQIIFSKAKLKIGYPYRMIRRLFFDIAILRSDFVYEANSIMHMLNILGSKKIIIDDFGFSYQKNIQNQIIYFAGASTKDKCWEEEKFAQLISIMANKYPHIQHIILQGIKEDEKFLDIYNKNRHHTNVILQQPMDLNTTMQFLANSKIVISNDTGIRNMAIAVDTPTVGIFFATGAFRYWPQAKIHRCVFNENYVSPDVQDVYIEIKFLIDLLKDKS
jgi:ADP-heptose:LPS heptosyltransferase